MKSAVTLYKEFRKSDQSKNHMGRDSSRQGLAAVEISGLVTKVNIKGHGENSGHLQFVVGGEHFLVTMQPDYEPRVFVVMANVVVAAFYAGQKVTVQFKTVAGVNRPTEIEVSRPSGE